MTLSEYIREVGTAAFARKFKVKERTAKAYMLAERFPKPALAKVIVSKTPVDWPGVYAGREAERRRANGSIQ